MNCVVKRHFRSDVLNDDIVVIRIRIQCQSCLFISSAVRCVGVGVVSGAATRLGLVGSDSSRLRRSVVNSSVRRHWWRRPANCCQTSRCHIHRHVYRRSLSLSACFSPCLSLSLSLCMSLTVHQVSSSHRLRLTQHLPVCRSTTITVAGGLA